MGNAGRVNKSSRDILVAFMHIPKTGGTTFHALLEQYFSEAGALRLCYWMRYGATLEDLLWLTEREKASIECLFGHFFYGTDRLIQKKTVYITILRHPIQRIWSQLAFHVSTNSLPGIDLSRGGDLKSILMGSLEHFTFQNLACRMISGVGARSFPVDEMVDLAIENVSREFLFVGRLEDVSMQTKLQVVLDVLKQPVQPIIAGNRLRVGDYDCLEGLTADLDLSEAIAAANLGDLKLYNSLFPGDPAT